LPGGRPKGSQVKPWQEALRKLAMARDGEGVKALDRLAAKTFQQAMGGDMTAAKEIANRLDGMPVQPTDNKTELSGELVIHWGSKPK
jgi:hypothetical protein